MAIPDQKMIESASDISKLGIVDWNRLNGYWQNDVTAPITIINTWLAGHAQYTIIREDLTQYPERSDWPGWHHIGDHEHYGRLYWNMFHECFHGELHFGDSPDFGGTILLPEIEVKPEIRFLGDVGRVSASTFIFSLFKLNAGDLWISVVNEETHIVIELMADIARVSSELRAKKLGLSEKAR